MSLRFACHFLHFRNQRLRRRHRQCLQLRKREAFQPVQTWGEERCGCRFKGITAVHVIIDCTHIVQGDLTLLVQLVFYFSHSLFNPAGCIGKVGVKSLHVRLYQQPIVHYQLRIETNGAEGRHEFSFLDGICGLPFVGNESSQAGNDDTIILQQ